MLVVHSLLFDALKLVCVAVMHSFIRQDYPKYGFMHISQALRLNVGISEDSLGVFGIDVSAIARIHYKDL